MLILWIFWSKAKNYWQQYNYEKKLWKLWKKFDSSSVFSNINKKYFMAKIESCDKEIATKF